MFIDKSDERMTIVEMIDINVPDRLQPEVQLFYKPFFNIEWERTALFCVPSVLRILLDPSGNISGKFITKAMEHRTKPYPLSVMQ